jgi:hypothetical protein
MLKIAIFSRILFSIFRTSTASGKAEIYKYMISVLILKMPLM